MHQWLVSGLLIVVLLPTRPAAGAASPAPPPAVVATAPQDRVPDAADLVPWPEAPYPRFAAGSVVDSGAWLLDAPAGRHGHVTTGTDGQLVCADGTPIRFWGTTLCYGATFPERPEEIERLADAIAAYGYNLVRFHHNDLPWDGIGFLPDDPVSNEALDPDEMDRLDRLAAALIARGVYLYVDLVDSRPMIAETGYPYWEALKQQHGWKGVFPHPTMVAAWKRAATAFLSHVNPYTGRSWAEEPAVVAVEVINENGRYWDWSHLVDPGTIAWYDSAWNAWLRERYGDRAGLATAWTDASGASGLHPDEDPAAGTVYRPRLIGLDHWDRSNRSKARGACRYNDYHAHLAELMAGFYREATAHLRDLGFRGVVIGSHELRGPSNQHAEVSGTGAIAAHLYAHGKLAWGARPGVRGVRVEGVDVRSNNWFSNLPRVSVSGAPGWNGEWAGVGTAFRADANLQVAAGSAFQRVAGSIHFSLAHRWRGVAMPHWDTTYAWLDYKQKIDRTFTSLHDAPWMAVNRAAAVLTLRDDLAPARYRVHLAISDADRREQNLHALGRGGGGGTIGDAALFLPLLHRTEFHFFDRVYDGDADVVFTTGRSASGDYSRARHAVILGDNPWCDPGHRRRDLAAPARLLHPGLRVAELETPTTVTLDWPWEAPIALELPRIEAALAIASLPSGATPIGRSADGEWTLGWCDDRHLVLPNARLLEDWGGDPRWLYRLYLAAARRWGLDLGDNAVDAPFYRSDTGELLTDWGTGTQVVDTPRTQLAAGFVGLRAGTRTANLDLEVARPFAAVALTSTDGEPIARSRRMLLVAAGRVTNSGQVIEGGRVTAVGEAPKLIEALHGELRLSGLADPDLVVHALDHAGRRLGEVPVEREVDGLRLRLDPAWRSLWFEVAGREVAGPEAPAEARAAWPGTAVPAPEVADRDRLTVAEFLDLLHRERRSQADAGPEASGRVVVAGPGNWQPFQVYGNLKGERGQREDGGPVVELHFGEHTEDWHGGTWFECRLPAGLAPERCRGLAVHLAGDGTLPREFHLTLKAGGGTWRSRNLKAEFEDPSWRELVLGPDDFVPRDGAEGPVPFHALDRIDVGCVGPLMANRHHLRLGAIALVVAPEPPGADPGASLPAIEMPDRPELHVPVGPAPRIDGAVDDPAWSRALGLAIDEGAVPGWQRIGSHVAEGRREGDEDARFWLLGTDDGLALLAVVRRAGGEPVANHGDWWHNDCVELFVATADEQRKPDSQTFLAYRRRGSDAAACSAGDAHIARARIDGGYALEALLPWTALGFDRKPSGPFRLDLQVDIADADGRRLLLSLATGTNEAWISSAHYLRARLAEGR